MLLSAHVGIPVRSGFHGQLTNRARHLVVRSPFNIGRARVCRGWYWDHGRRLCHRGRTATIFAGQGCWTTRGRGGVGARITTGGDCVCGGVAADAPSSVTNGRAEALGTIRIGGVLTTEGSTPIQAQGRSRSHGGVWTRRDQTK